MDYTFVTFPRILARNRNKDDVICYAEIYYWARPSDNDDKDPVINLYNIRSYPFRTHRVREHVTSVDAA
jgi:hypothetical protein